jgi:hypothetical protein
MQSFDFTGGLGEASAWLCLRQDIYISLVHQTPVRTDLDTFSQSDVFHRTDDLAYASRMVFLLAKALNCAFGEGSSREPRLREISGEIDRWFELKPATFEPIRCIPRDTRKGTRIPEIWMLLPCHGKYICTCYILCVQRQSDIE